MAGFLFAILFAALMAAIFVFTLGWEHPRRDGEKVARWLFFFVVVWLTTWAIGVWTPAIGPVAFGVPWMLFLFLALIVALVIASATPYPRERRTGHQRVNAATSEESRTETAEEQSLAVGFGMFFWVLLVVLMVSLMTRFFLWTPFAPVHGQAPSSLPR